MVFGRKPEPDTEPEDQPSNNPLENRTNLIILGVLALIAFFVFAPQMTDDDNTSEDVTDNRDSPPVAQSANADVDLGRLVVSERINSDGCAINPRNTVTNADEFYVIAPDSEVAEGTEIFARLYLDNEAIEDVPIIEANQDYESTCVNFEFETTDGRAFERGEYEVEFFVNGNSYDIVSFDVQ